MKYTSIETITNPEMISFMTGSTTFYYNIKKTRTYTEKNVRKRLKELGYDKYVGKCLGKGYSRIVFEYVGEGCKEGEAVIKIEFTRLFGDLKRVAGTVSNLTEWMVWETASEDLKKHLAPVYGISQDEMFLIMQRAQPNIVDDYGNNCWDDFWDDVYSVRGVIRDIKPDNTGWIDGRLVMIDYALLTEYSERKVHTTYQNNYTFKEVVMEEPEIWERIKEWKDEEK